MATPFHSTRVITIEWMNPQVKQEGSNPNPRITSPVAASHISNTSMSSSNSTTQRTVCKPRFECNAW